MVTPIFFLSLVALLISVFSGVYFLYLWFTSGKKHAFLLFWAYALGTILWFKIPNILINAGFSAVQSDYYIFFYVTLLVGFLAYPALIWGLISFRGFSQKKYYISFFLIWFFASAAYYSLSFFVEGFDVSYAPVWAGHLFFFIPAQICLLFRLWRTGQWSSPTHNIPKSSILLASLGTYILTCTSILYILTQIGAVHRGYWYYAVISSPWISVLQILSGLLLFFGFRILALSRISGNK